MKLKLKLNNHKNLNFIIGNINEKIELEKLLNELIQILLF